MRFGDVSNRQKRGRSCDGAASRAGRRSAQCADTGPPAPIVALPILLRGGGLLSFVLGILTFDLWTFARPSRIHLQKIEPNIDFDSRLHLFTLQGAHALLEQLTVELESHRGDVAALLWAEEIACAAN